MEEQSHTPIHKIDGKSFPKLAVLDSEELSEFSAHAEQVQLAANVAVMFEGQPSHYLFLVESGKLMVNKRHGDETFEVGSILPGDLFGEASLLYNSPAGAEVRTAETTSLLRIPAETVHRALESNEAFNRALRQVAERRSAASALAVNPIFSRLSQVVREIVIYNSSFISIEAGETLIKEGDTDTDAMYLVLAGHAEANMKHPRDATKTLVVAYLSSGDEIGEISVITGKPRAFSVIAVSPMRLLRIKGASIQAWRNRYSDFNHALYGSVQKKLQNTLDSLGKIVDENEAALRTIRMLPPEHDI